MAQSAAQLRAQNRLKAAAKAAKKKGLKGNAFRTFVGNATRGKGGGSKKPGTKVAKKGGGNPSPAAAGTSSPKKPPRMGSVYSSAKSTFLAISPVTDEVIIGVAREDSPQDILTAAGRKVFTFEEAYNLGIVGLDAAIDKVTNHKQALSGGSLTAWAPEVYLFALAGDTIRQKVGTQRPSFTLRAAQRRVVQAHQGYNPQQNKLVLDNPEFRTYRLARHGGQILRKARGKSALVKRVTKPIADFMSMIGGRF